MATAELAERVGVLLAQSPERRAGLVVAVESRGERGFWHRGRLPYGPGTIFEIGSITKTFTGLLLHEGGTGGFRSFAGVIPDADAAVVVLATGRRPPAALRPLVRAARGVRARGESRPGLSGLTRNRL